MCCVEPFSKCCQYAVRSLRSRSSVWEREREPIVHTESSGCCREAGRAGCLDRTSQDRHRAFRGEPICCSVFHEATHALFDLTTNAFSYPLAIAEGFARAAEYVPYHTGNCLPKDVPQWHVGGGADGCLSPDQTRSIRDLLYHGALISTRADRKKRERFGLASYWFVSFLGDMCSIARSSVDLARTPNESRNGTSGVYEWILRAMQRTSEELEREFFDYCTTRSITFNPFSRATGKDG
jgi:hypothetical protein